MVVSSSENLMLDSCQMCTRKTSSTKICKCPKILMPICRLPRVPAQVLTLSSEHVYKLQGAYSSCSWDKYSKPSGE